MMSGLMRTANFINDVGGGNFTELAPRPPVPGEENERQSSGGTSTRSTGSHKSQVSGKSHTSSKSGVSHRSDVPQSPAATPRRSNLDRTLATLDVSSNKSKLDLSMRDIDAPLGFEPEGSAASSPPFTENSSPSYLKWAESLAHLMEDSDGVKLFKQFLDQEHSSNSLEFLFACKGLQLVSPSDHTRIQSLVKLIYKKYIKGDQLNLQPEVKKTIVEKLRHIECVDQTIFYEAQELVETSVRTETYPLFLKSDLYIQYVQSGGESPKTSNTSSGSNSARPVSALLPTLREGEELKQEDLKKGSNASLTLTPGNIMATTSQRLHQSFNRREGVFPHPGQVPHRVVNPYHVSYAPNSAQDSEGQSMSSDALTDDNMSLTDSSVDGRGEGPPYGKKWKRQLRAIHKNGPINKYPGLPQNFIIPRTERAPKDRNLAEINPDRFAAMLISRLEKVKEDTEKYERMKQSMKMIETDEESEDARPAKSLGALFALATDKDRDDGDAQSILDEHFSRVWENSVGQTPVRTPGRHSPPKTWSADVSILRPGAPGPSPNVSGMSLCPGSTASASASIPGKGYHHSKRKPDNTPSVNASQQLETSQSEDKSYSVHYYHHHHHHHSKDSNKHDKIRQQLEQEAQHRTMQTFLPSTGSARAHNSGASDASQLYDETGKSSRSKDSKRSSSKKSSDSSTVDSGVGLLYDIQDPSKQKVLAWMLENDQIQTGPTQYSTDNSDKASSHKKSLKSASTSHNKSTSSSSKKQSQFSARSGSVERPPLNAGIAGGFPYPVMPVQPSQPISQDPSMPLLTPPNPTTQLEEAKRRLQEESKQRMTKSKSFTGTMQPPMQQKRPMPPPSHPATPRTLPQNKSSLPQVAPLDLSSSEEYGMSSLPKPDKKKRPSSSAPTTPSPDVTVVAYYIPGEPIPYRTNIPGRNITLGQFKQHVTKKGAFRYFFKMASDEFDCGVVNEEVTDDEAILPTWEGKIVCRLEKAD